ncbi:transporter substrate-binding domain-containing protein (plasmid) [Deinococcus sp. KNUC1210]|uniref:substrate-binding periplasmic protein n=1 Tax=Deinococcus sp. KNUC1210 TaxID=2917691 RepID=UPI001EEFAFAF|nr:transporter substrate-binding domain-containing protein [Deinococcus sp. KNUC1210]ULH17081.1 transporter substrate-binding domain-containing protein [Deinococcus sp. KNUC1210]
MTLFRSLMLSTLLLVSTAQAADLGRIQTAGTFRLAYSTNQPALISSDNNAISGFATELMALIAKEMKIGSVSWRNTSTPDQLVQGLQAATYDAIIDTHLPQPLGGVDLSKPIACVGGVILARPKGPSTEQALQGKRIAVVTNSPYYYYVRNLPFEKKISVFATEDQALIGFLSGNIDALILDRYAALKIFKKVGSKQFQVSPLLWSQDIDVVVAHSDNKEVLSGINAALKKFQADGTYSALSMKYFNQDVRCVL